MMSIKIGPDTATLEDEWECKTNQQLANRLNERFSWERYSPSQDHIVEQAAVYFGGEVLVGPEPWDPEAIY